MVGGCDGDADGLQVVGRNVGIEDGFDVGPIVGEYVFCAIARTLNWLASRPNSLLAPTMQLVPTPA